MGVLFLIIVTISVVWLQSIQTENLTDSNVQPNIVGGRDAIDGEILYQAMILIKKEKLIRPFCGGSILNPVTILTAAHCSVLLKNIEFPFLPYIGAGGISYNHMQFRKVGKIKIHPSWNQTGFNESDISLLILSKKLTFSASVQPIAIADKQPTVNTSCLVSGWGLHNMTYKREDSFTEPMKVANMHVTNPEKCRIFFLLLTQAKFNAESQICATGEGGTPCSGDSGGPFVCNQVQYGIVSFGISTCMFSHLPSVYTDVSNFKDWIDSNTETSHSTSILILNLPFNPN